MITSPDVLDPLVALALNVLAAAVTLAVGWALAAYLERLVRTLTARHPRVDLTLATLAGRLLRALVVVLTVIAVLDRFGVQTTSFVALIGAAGLAVGLSLQGALGNVAAGILVLLLRPYKVGDAVMMNGTAQGRRRRDDERHGRRRRRDRPVRHQAAQLRGRGGVRAERDGVEQRGAELLAG